MKSSTPPGPHTPNVSTGTAARTTMLRPPVQPIIATLSHIVLPGPAAGPLRVQHAHITAPSNTALLDHVIFARSLVESDVVAQCSLATHDCLVTSPLRGAVLDVSGCFVGALKRPGGAWALPYGDGIHLCPSTYGPARDDDTRDDRSNIMETDVVESPTTRPRTYGQALVGVRICCGGNVVILRTRITGWQGGAIVIRSEHGPLDCVTIDSCYCAGGGPVQIHIGDGGHGRPRNVSILNTILGYGPSGQPHPVSTADVAGGDGSQSRYVRSEEHRLDPTWVVYRNVSDPLGTALPPPTGWYDPTHDSYSWVF